MKFKESEKRELKKSTSELKEAVLKDGGITSLLTFVESSPGKRTVDIATSLNISMRTTERWIKKLREEGKIEFRGSKKTGGYYVTGKQ